MIDQVVTPTGGGTTPPPVVAKCFLRGTDILTECGPVPVERLRIGDRVATRHGGPAGGSAPIRWIGRLSYTRQPGTPWRGASVPVRVAASAIGPGVPARDLYVSQMHALFIDGVLISARELVNDTSITFASPDDGDRLDYFHIELAEHAVLTANGAGAESFLADEDGSREAFANFAEYARLYGTATVLMAACAPAYRYNRASQDAMALFRLAATRVGIDLRDPSQIAYERLADRGRQMAEGLPAAEGVPVEA